MRFRKSSTTLVCIAAVAALASACGDGAGAVPPGDAGASRPLDDAGVAVDGATTPRPGEDASPAVERDAAAGSTTSTASAKQSLIWVWTDYPASIQAVAANAASFTHVSPALYQLNYDYTGGVPQFWNTTSDSFTGITSAEVAQRIHAAGMKCVPLVFGGGGNAGTDKGIQNILADAPPGTRQSFITSMVNEAVAKGYDGYNLDWEIDGSETTYANYGAALESFLADFKAALNAHGMQLSFDLGTWYLKQTWCSGGNGVVDLTKIGAVVDLAVVEAYSTHLGAASSSCPASLPDPQLCSDDFMSVLNLMCVYVPNAAISMGFNANGATGSNDIAGDVVAVTQAYGIRNVALWPDWNSDGPNGAYVLADPKGIQPTHATWFSLLAGFLAAK